MSKLTLQDIEQNPTAERGGVDVVLSEVQAIAGAIHWSPCVVVADDDPAMLSLVSTKLRLGGLCVHALTSGADVLRAVQLVPVDLVVLDVAMPGLSGLSVLDNMQSDSALSKIPVILLTARSGQRSVTAGFRAGAVDYITKPFSPEDLLTRVRAAVA